MSRSRPCLALGLLLVTPALPALAQDRPPPSPLEVRCRQEVERRHPPGSLSRGREERRRLIQACIANGGTLPS